jgi:hypothetical protein
LPQRRFDVLDHPIHQFALKRIEEVQNDRFRGQGELCRIRANTLNVIALTLIGIRANILLCIEREALRKFDSDDALERILGGSQQNQSFTGTYVDEHVIRVADGDVL